MREFQFGDIIGYQSPDDGYIYGVVADITEESLECDSIDDSQESFCILKNEANYIEPVYLDDETTKKFARYEITAGDFIGDVYPPERVRTKKRYNITVDDLLCVLKKANGMPIEQFKEEWLTPIWETLHYSFSYGDAETEDFGDNGYRFLPSEGFFVWNAIDRVDNDIYDKINDYSDIIAELERVKRDLLLPIAERNYDESIKAHYIKCFDEHNMLEKATDEELSLFIKYVNELCEKNNKTALYAKAYGCYGGNRAFSCDWTASRDCLLKLMGIDENPAIANTLGYIYYYGRCTGGEPEYEKAFKYYSIGAAGYFYESRYKLSDMFCHGYGVPKNSKIAASLIWELYNENIDYIFDGRFDSKFADIAFRAGNLFRDGVNCEASPNDAYYYYLQSYFAIKMRMLKKDHYGDAKVADSIRKAIDEVLPQTSYEKPKATLHAGSIENIVRYHCKKDRLIELKIKQIKNNEYSLKFRILPKNDEKYAPKWFITEPSAHFCGLLDSIKAKTVDCEKIKIHGKILSDDTATIVFDSAKIDGLYYYGKLIAEIDSRQYIIKLPTNKNFEKCHFVSVVFNTGGHAYDYICNNRNVVVGDKVFVETNQGKTAVEVVRVFDKDTTETALPISKYKSVLDE